MHCCRFADLYKFVIATYSGDSNSEIDLREKHFEYLTKEDHAKLYVLKLNLNKILVRDSMSNIHIHFLTFHLNVGNPSLQVYPTDSFHFSSRLYTWKVNWKQRVSDACGLAAKYTIRHRVQCPGWKGTS